MLREKIARLIMHRDYEAGEVWCDWESREPTAETTRESYREDADEILALFRKEIEKLKPLSDEEQQEIMGYTYWEASYKLELLLQAQLEAVKKELEGR